MENSEQNNPEANDQPTKISRQGRVIIRNIPYDLKENHLRKDFSKYGKINNISLPLKNENGLNRGFAFIEFETKEEALKLIETFKDQRYKGRKVEIEISLPKQKYENKIQHIIENTH